MRGDKIRVEDKHRRAAIEIVRIILPSIMTNSGRYAVSIGGESGSGKSELAVATAEVLHKHRIGSLILQQDDYFVYPPHTNDARRREDINHVGPAEVRLDLLDDHVNAIINGTKAIEKPLVVYRENRIVTETLPVDGVDVVIAEGTYVTLLENVHSRIFIDQTYQQTRNTRLKRNREPYDPFIERVLEIEHNIISFQRDCADIIVTASFTIVTQSPRGKACQSPANHGSLSKGVITEGNLRRANL